MDANNVVIKETIPASRKLGDKDARELLKDSSKLVVAKGKNLAQLKIPDRITKDLVESVLGPTGNLRAPCLRVGKTLVVGFNEEAYREIFG